MLGSKSQSAVQDLPKLEEWAVMSKHKAEEYQRMKELEKLQQYEKMMKFREGLDDQIKNKGNARKGEEQKDKVYYEYAKKNSRQYNEEKEREKRDKYMKRKMMEEENNKIANEIANSRTKNVENSYNLQIGLKSQKEQKINEERGKRQMINGLERQLKEKNQKLMKQKINDYRLSLEHQRNQPQHFQNHKREKSKEYKQNPKAYENYAYLLMEKQMQQKELERRMVDEAAQKKAEEDRKRRQEQKRKKHILSTDMMDSLEHQVKIYQYKKAQEKKVNPQDVSYGFISNVFRQKPSAFDKNKYYEDLRKQAEEQKLQKKKLSYMSEQQYKLNRNQLNKIVNGKYTYDQYVDRSLGAIGENRRVHSMLGTHEDEDANYIKGKLNHIRGNKSYLGRLQNSSIH